MQVTSSPKVVGTEEVPYLRRPGDLVVYNHVVGGRRRRRAQILLSATMVKTLVLAALSVLITGTTAQTAGQWGQVYSPSK